MSGRFFLDTNILVYLLDPTVDRQPISQSLVLKALENGEGIISTQVVQEFINLATGKFAVKTSLDNTREFLQKVLLPLCQIYPDIDLFSLAIDIQAETQFSYYDSLILAAAVVGGCNILYTEDMQSGQKVRGVEIFNPYLPGAGLLK